MERTALLIARRTLEQKIGASTDDESFPQPTCKTPDKVFQHQMTTNERQGEGPRHFFRKLLGELKVCPGIHTYGRSSYTIHIDSGTFERRLKLYHSERSIFTPSLNTQVISPMTSVGIQQFKRVLESRTFFYRRSDKQVCHSKYFKSI